MKSLLTAFTGFSAFWYFSYAYLYLYETNYVPVKPYHWYLFTIVGILFLQLLSANLGRFRPAQIKLVFWVTCFMVLLALGFLNSKQDEAAVQLLINCLEAMAILGIMLVVLGDERICQAVGIAIVVAAAFGVLMVFVDYLFFVDDKDIMSEYRGRAGGLYRNPNIAGKHLVFGLIVSAWVLPRYLRWWFSMFIGLAVLLTFSRSSMMMWGISMLSLAWFDRFLMPRGRAVLLVALMLAGAASLIVLENAVGIFELVGLSEQLNEDSTGRLTGSFFEQTDKSAIQRRMIAGASLDLFLQSPIFGGGLASTSDWDFAVGTHNMYLWLAAELGALGLLLYLWLILIYWSVGAPLARTFVLALILSSLFTHNTLEQPSMAVVFAFVALRPYLRSIRRNRRVDATRLESKDQLIHEQL